MSGDVVFDFNAVAGVRWRVVSTVWNCPPGSFEVGIEWENGEEASFTTMSRDIYDWAEQHFAEEEVWFDSPLPKSLTEYSWMKLDRLIEMLSDYRVTQGTSK